jgi:hypothetical protein
LLAISIAVEVNDMADKNSLLETDLPDYESDHFNASDIGGSTPKNSLLDTDIGNDETEKKSIQPVTKTQTTGMMPWSEAATEAVKNVPQSAYHNFVEPIVNYEQTLQGLKQVGKGLYSKAEGAFVDQDQAKKAEDEAAINALKQNYIDTYGSLEKFQQEFRKDPLRILSDASMLLTGGGSMAARLPGVVGKAGEAVATVGKAVDPIMAAAQVPKVAGKAITSALNVPATVQSGSAFGSLQKAYEAGVSKDPIFWDHYSGKADANALIDKVSGAIDNVAKKRSADYIAGMDPRKATDGLSYQPVLDEIANARGAQSRGIGSFYGQTTNRAAQDVLDNIENTVNTWMSKPNGTPFHTLEGFDALKRTIGDYRRDVRGNPEATKVVDNAYNAVKEAIVKVDPKYADIMDQYAEASQKLNDLKSLERGKSSETKINKILKTYRSGDKGNLLSDLYKHDPELISAIAGHDLSPLFPQGLRGILTSAPFYGGFAALGNVAHLPGLAMSSPKLMGGFNYGLGRIAGAPARGVENLPYLARQAPYGASRIDEANRQGRKSGGRVSHETIADQLIAAAESAKKMHGQRTEVLLDQPDETITKALAVAKQNI